LTSWLTSPAQASSNGITGWKLVWADEFDQPDGTAPSTANWNYDIGASGWGNNELEYYTSRTNNARIENGQLVIEAIKENYLGSAYTSARLKTQGKWSWSYGRIEARIKIPYGQGIWPAFWMLGTNISSVGWPACGEIDILENIGKEPATVHGTIHGPGYSGDSAIGGPYSLPGAAAFADSFHVYALEWTTNQLKWYVDGQQYFSTSPDSLPGGSAWVFTQAQFIILNVAVGGNWPGYPDGTSTFPQRMLVDYVRVYSATNLPAGRENALVNPGFEAGNLAPWLTYGAGFNTPLEHIANVPVHNGSQVFKVFGQFSGGDNYSGVLQDQPVTPGQTFIAEGWALTPAGDRIAAGNSAWLEVSFRDASSNMVSLYRSEPMTPDSAPGSWTRLAVTNQFDPATFAPLGQTVELEVPPGASFARCQIVFHQPSMGAGAVLFDDIRLASGPADGFPVPVSASRDQQQVRLEFDTFLGLPYQLGWKASLADGSWQHLTNIIGDGARQTARDSLQAGARFYRLLRTTD